MARLRLVLFCGLARALVEREVRVFESRNETVRYLSVVKTSKSWTLVGKRSVVSHKKKVREYLVAWRECDARLRCGDGAALTDASDAVEQNFAHNAAPFLWRGQTWYLGGRDDVRRRGRNGVYLWQPLSRPISAFDGFAASCEEKRPQFKGRCEFDGKFSVAPLRDSFVLYARANLAWDADTRGNFGGRHLQAATFRMSPAFHFESPFQRLRFIGYPETPGTRDNIYFAAVNANPTDTSTLVGLFPVTSPALPEPAIAMAISCDSITFSSLHILRASSDASFGRTRDHPVDGFIVTTRRHNVAFFIQTNVPGIDLRDDLDEGGNTAIVRIDLPFLYLRNLTASALRQLRRDHYDRSSSIPFPCDDLLLEAGDSR